MRIATCTSCQGYSIARRAFRARSERDHGHPLAICRCTDRPHTHGHADPHVHSCVHIRAGKGGLDWLVRACAHNMARRGGEGGGGTLMTWAVVERIVAYSGAALGSRKACHTYQTQTARQKQSESEQAPVGHLVRQVSGVDMRKRTASSAATPHHAPDGTEAILPPKWQKRDLIASSTRMQSHAK